ncbi:MAG: peptidyl-prolyl cis-trans isomerase [Nibricoccus sp.]
MTFVRSFSSRALLPLALALSPLSLLAQTPPAAPSTPPSDGMDLRFANGIVAVVEDKAITVDDVRRKIQPFLPEMQRSARNEKEFNEKLEALQDDIIQTEIDKVLVVKEFYKEKDGEPKKTIPTSYVDNQLSEILITQYDNDRSKFLAELRRQGKTIRDFRREIEQDIVEGYMRQQQKKSQSIISPVKVETFYNENKDKFYQEDSVHLRLIQFNRTAGATDADLRAKAEAALARVKAGEKFEDVAKDVSQDMKRAKGGDWGSQKRSDLKPELSDPLFKLAKGEVTAPIIMPEGAFLLYVEDRKFAGTQPIDEVRDQIERILVQQMARSSQERWLERLRRNGYVKHY